MTVLDALTTRVDRRFVWLLLAGSIYIVCTPFLFSGLVAVFPF